MKTIAFLTLFALYPISNIISQDTTGNILINGGFESVTNGKVPDGWTADSRYYSPAEEKVSGRLSLEYSNDNPSNYPICYQKVDLKPGMTYKAGVMVKTSDVAGADYGASICVQWVDKNNKWLGGIFPKGIKGTSDWTEISTIFTVPADAAGEVFSCYVRKGMTGKAWFDNVWLKPFDYDKMNILLLSPAYRELMFEDRDSVISLSVNLDGFRENLSRSQLDAELIDSSGEKLKSNITEIIPDSLNYIINIDAADIPTGSYHLNVNLTGKNNKLLDSQQLLIKKLAAGNKPGVYFDNYNRLIVNGKAMFPLGMYWGYIDEPDLKIYADSKFNFLLPYTPPTDQQLQLAQKYNMKVIYSVKDFYEGLKDAPPQIKTVSDETVYLDKQVEHFKDNPSLIAWYTNDELRLDFIDRMNDHYRHLSELDQNHPVFSLIVFPDQTGFYLQSCDVIGSDPYVIPKSPLSDVGLAARTINQNVKHSRPFWQVIQAHDLGDYKEQVPDPQNYRSPTYDEMRNMSWQSICEGATGLLFYSFFDLKRNPDVPFETQWSNLKKIAAEIDSLSDVLLSVEKTGVVKVEGAAGDNSWFDWTAKKYKNHLFIFATGNGKSAGEITIKIPPGYSGVHIMNEPAKKLTINNSEFSDSLGKTDLKIYVTD